MRYNKLKFIATRFGCSLASWQVGGKSFGHLVADNSVKSEFKDLGFAKF